MAYSLSNFSIKKLLDKIDWKLLLFLMLFLNVKLAAKIPAIVLIYLLRFNFRFQFSFKNSRLPLFYALIFGLACLSLVINHNYTSHNYILVFLTGIVFWGLCLLAVHQVKLSVEQNDTQVIHNTILVFFILNTLLSFLNIAQIIWETGAINPYRYQGECQKYFIGTGDYIKGLTFDISTTNAVLNAFGVAYFLTRKNLGMVLTCMAVLLLTGSNFTNLALMCVLVFLFAFKTDRNQRSVIVVCLMFLVIFMAKISPQNNGYAWQTFKNAVDPPTLESFKINEVKKVMPPSQEDRRRTIAKNYLDSIKGIALKEQAVVLRPPFVPYTEGGRFVIPGPDINTKPYQTPTDTTAEQRQLLAFIDEHRSALPLSSQNSFSWGLPGKGIAMVQTVKFLQHHPAKLVVGDGIGNFSSKIAFKATNLGLAGGYPAKYAYINTDFIRNHLDVYLNFFSKRAELHSLTNSPFSVYDQMLAEYGLMGLMVFCLFYLGYFAKHYRQLTYGLPVLLLMLAVFFIDYWFEQLSIIVFFELLLLLDIKEHTVLKPLKYAYHRA